MKKLLCAILLLLCATFTIDLTYNPRGISNVEILRDGINRCRMLTWQNPEFGYEISYPEFFEAETDETGHTRFCFRNETNIVVDSFFVDNINKITANATKINRKGGNIIAEGRYHESGGAVGGYKYHTKAIRQGRQWLAYRIVYEEAYEESVYRIIQAIDRWQPLA